MRISDWSSDVCSSDLGEEARQGDDDLVGIAARVLDIEEAFAARSAGLVDDHHGLFHEAMLLHDALDHAGHLVRAAARARWDDEFDVLSRLPLSLGIARTNQAEGQSAGDQRRRYH